MKRICRSQLAFTAPGLRNGQKETPDASARTCRNCGCCHVSTLERHNNYVQGQGGNCPVWW